MNNDERQTPEVSAISADVDIDADTDTELSNFSVACECTLPI